MQKIINSLLLAGLVVISFLSYNILTEIRAPHAGSITVGNEYNATTTSTGRFTVGAVTLKTGPGALGSVVLTGAAAGTFDFYDATTSNINLRASSMASSSILIASIPLSAVAGNYIFDLATSNGLLLNTTGTLATSTITYR